ncbi:metalloendoproteinase 1-MMP [Prunus yedoensis var. nudiflora]|uniref:Metalloendoproteinase 1-MMP n=1 Tax=Prunus yedoensis var. nudiflora TaxID=2094558 RepID=A0A314U6F8_PRUYE|nr:metalloendoproteinase 1-MMP [Prunus yedoensis var. nudiflora]
MFPFVSCNSFFFLLCLCILCFSRPCFPARILSNSVTVLTAASDVHNATWHDFERFLDAGRGSQVSGMSELKNYFHRFGYLPNSNFTDIFDTDFESALTLYQSKLSLPVTGRLDSDTISAIISPRCGVSDASQQTLFMRRVTLPSSMESRGGSATTL